MTKKQKIKLDVTSSDCQALLRGERFDWTFPTDKGENIDIHVYNPDETTHDDVCPRCIEDYADEDGKWHDGEEKPSACDECGVCKDCEHMSECSKSK